MKPYSTVNQIEIKKLANGLMDRGIQFTVLPMYGGSQIRCTKWDAICHEYSYGHERGLLEIMGLPECGDDVLGWRTADEVLAMVDKLLEEENDTE